MAQLSSAVADSRLGPVRTWAYGSIVGGLLFVAASVHEWVSDASAITSLLLASALIVTVAGLVGLHVRYGDRYGMLGAVGVLAAVTGQVVQAASAAGEALRAGHSMATALFVVGSVLFLVGLVSLTVAIFRAGVEARWIGLVLIAGILASGVAQSQGGSGLFGLAWIVIGVLLLRANPTAQPFVRSLGSTRSGPRRVTGESSR